jgi:putative ABC transport system permease protein
MMRVALRGLWGRKLRTVLTGLSIVLGTSMIAGTFIVRAQIENAFSDIFFESNKGTDVILSKRPAFTGDQTQAGPLPASLIDRVRQIDGVATAEGQIQASGSIVVDGKYVSSSGGAPNLVVSSVGPPFNEATSYIQGHAPSASGEISLIEKTANDNHLRVGQQVRLTTEQGTVPVRIAGIFKLAGVSSIGAATVVATTFSDAQQWYDRVGKTSTILVDGDPGISPEDLRARIRRLLPHEVKVQTGQQNAQEQTDQVTGSINGFLTPLLLAFAGAAVFVGGFIIFNTFSITVAQRTREFAMLRTIGASRRQVLVAVLVEALMIGLLASLAGVLLGFAFAKGLNALFDAAGFGIPTAAITVPALAVILPLLVGSLIALLASLGPAVRATRVPPIAALREGAELPPSALHRYLPAISGLLGAVGLGFVLLALFGSQDTTGTLLTLAGGAILCFIAAAIASRWVVGPFARVIGWPAERLSRTSGRLARENATRNPGRTAVTASALMIGLGLVVFVAVFVNGFKESFLGAIDRELTSDLIISSDNFSTPIPKLAVQESNAISGVQAAGIQFTQARIGHGGTDTINGIDPSTFQGLYRFDWQKSGSDELLPQLSGDQALIEEQFAKSHDLAPGDSFRVTSADGVTLHLHVLGEYKDPVLMTGFIIPSGTFDRFTDQSDYGVVLVGLPKGTDVGAVQHRVEGALKGFPMAKVRTNAEYKSYTENQVNQFLAILYVLLAMSVIISLFGIVNTLALSVFERTREIGMLRAIGMTRRQLRRVVRWESVITAIIGGLLGIAIGLVFGWLVSVSLADQGVIFAIPTSQLVLSLVVAAIAGLLAAILPARRASRLNVLEALQYE